jgi:hypothetical protein
MTPVSRPSVMAACEQQGVALLDRRGTVVLNAPPSFIHVAALLHGVYWTVHLAPVVEAFALTRTSGEPAAGRGRGHIGSRPGLSRSVAGVTAD